MIRLEHAAIVGSELALRFADGEEIYLTLDMLRPVQQIGARGFELQRFEGVGGYALQLFWADGHSTGIYTFDYLRRLALIP